VHEHLVERLHPLIDAQRRQDRFDEVNGLDLEEVAGRAARVVCDDTEFTTEVLGRIVRTFNVDYVLTTTPFGARAAQGLLQAATPTLTFTGAIELGAIYEPVKGSTTP
jgi:hypothetical protein